MIAAASGASSGGPGHVVEIVLAVLLIGGGIRSLLVWFRTEFDAESPRDRFLYSLFASARVGTWLSLGGYFLGYAVVNEPQAIRLFPLVPLALAGVQVLAGMALGRTSGRGRAAPPPVDGPPGLNGGREVKSARILANEAMQSLRAAGYSDREIRRLADEYIALDRGEGLREFVAWAKDHAARGRR